MILGTFGSFVDWACLCLLQMDVLADTLLILVVHPQAQSSNSQKKLVASISNELH